MSLDPDALLAAADKARQDSADEEIAQITVLSFVWGTAWYALPIEAVHEVVELRQMTIIPGLPPHLLGATNHRGDVLAVIDVRCLLDRKPGLVGAHSHLVVVHIDDEPAGLLVDELGDIHLVPDPAQFLDGQRALFLDTGGPDGQPISLIDPDQLIDLIRQAS